MRIFLKSQTKKTVRAILFTGPDGRKMISFPDQGIVKGCDELKKIGDGTMDHRGSKDWEEELRRRNEPMENRPMENQPSSTQDKEKLGF